jgi:hypothetical protein
MGKRIKIKNMNSREEAKQNNNEEKKRRSYIYIYFINNKFEKQEKSFN